jgi:choline kinase
MNILILAAGQGTRLKKLNYNKPKCLLKLNGKSIIKRNLTIFKNAKLNPILITGFQKEQLYFLKIKQVFNSEYSNTNMLWSLYKAIEYMNEDFMVCYGDILVNSKQVNDLKKFKDGIGLLIDKDWLKYWKLRFKNPLSDAESLEVNRKGEITDIGQKVDDITKIQGQYTGFLKISGNTRIIFKNKLIDYCQNKKSSNFARKSFLTDFLMYLVNQGIVIKEIPTYGGWIEIDSPKDVQAAEISGRLKLLDDDLKNLNII